MREERFAKTKIIGTVGPASTNPGMLSDLIQEGVDIFRINSAHGEQEQHQEIIEMVRTQGEQLDIPVAILYDLAGPKIRLGALPEEGVELETGTEVILEESSEKTSDRLPVECDRFVEMISPGKLIFINEGFVQLTVQSIEDREVRASVDIGGTVTTHKGVNLPGIELQLPVLSEKDESNLRFALRHEVDWIGLSFVRDQDDIKELNAIMESEGIQRPVIAKIETPQAVGKINDIVNAFQGCMVARGDLGVEIPIEYVPHVQKHIIRKCNEAGKPVITATQMLESMVTKSRPTRAEAADVANAIYDGTDCVMLSGETAVGQFPVKTVHMMNKIILATEQNIDYTSGIFGEMSEKTIADSVSHAVFQAAVEVKASAIVTMTFSGSTARMVSKYRPPVPIFAITPVRHVQRQLNLVWGVSPILSRESESTDAMFEEAEKILLARGVVEPGDKIVLSAGVPIGVPGTTNLMKVRVVGD